MWVDEEIEATVEFSSCLTFPCLRAIRFGNHDVEFARPLRVDRTPSALLYRASAANGEYTIRFETTQQRWVLETAPAQAPRSWVLTPRARRRLVRPLASALALPWAPGIAGAVEEVES